ncbi:MAG: hypothetical protein ACJ8F1_07735 [Polyangia bacterium]
MARGPSVAAVVVLAAFACLPARAGARARPRFEPTDLEWEDTGVAELDLQFGPVRGQGPWRIVVPDFELDLGLLPWLEIDLDGAYAVEGPATGPFSLDHSAPDALWLSAKLGVYGIHDAGGAFGAALGFQVGPKLPVAPGAHGLGVESLVLTGGMVGRLTAVLNLGGFIDPAPNAISGRQTGVEAGLDLQFRLDAQNRFGLTGELGGTHFISPDPDQLQATLGFVWSVRPTLDLSLTGLIGSLSGGDRYGLLLGVSPKVRLFNN